MKNRISKTLIVGTCTAVVATASYALIRPTSNSEIEITLHNPTILNEEQHPAEDLSTPTASSDLATAKTRQYNWIIEPGDTLSSIFSKLGLTVDDLHGLVYANGFSKLLDSIAIGKALKFYVNENGQLEQLVYQKSPLESIVATRNDTDFTIENQSIEVEKRTITAHTVIQDSLFEDGKKAGLEDKTIMQLTQIFAWDIDFATNLHPGDEVTVLYEKSYVNDFEIDTGDIIAAEVINQERTYRAIRHIDQEGSKSYYTPEGRSMRKAFLRTPVDFARISSKFNLRRKHPVLHKIRAHRGVDFAAKIGTPVKSTGDGKIKFKGRKGGYGRVVTVQHGETYTTLYAHLINYAPGLKAGSQVKQGQIIGYVGQSGLASGPHLHYEFRVNGRHRNPLTVRLPNADPIDKSFLPEFKRQALTLLVELEAAKTVVLAQMQKK